VAIRLWGRPTSTNTQRVLWTLAEAGRPYEFTLASGTTGESGYVWQGHQPYGIVDKPEYRAMNPNGTIPTLDDDGFVIWESIAIVQYLARKYAPALLGGGEAAFARALQWMIWTNHALEPTMHTLVMHRVRLPKERRSEEAVEGARQDALQKLAILEARLAQADYIAGDTFGIGDIPAGIAIRRFLHFGLTHPRLPAIERWMARLGEREGFRKHVAPRENHIRHG
jgi:glutathione S-transferase